MVANHTFLKYFSINILFVALLLYPSILSNYNTTKFERYDGVQTKGFNVVDLRNMKTLLLFDEILEFRSARI